MSSNGPAVVTTSSNGSVTARSTGSGELRGSAERLEKKSVSAINLASEAEKARKQMNKQLQRGQSAVALTAGEEMRAAAAADPDYSPRPTYNYTKDSAGVHVSDIEKAKRKYKEEKEARERRTKLNLSTSLMSGRLKMRRSMIKVWEVFHFELKPGILYWKTDANAQDYKGSVLLAGTVTVERPSKKGGFCFKIYHPLKHGIYGPEAFFQTDNCILRAADKETGIRWMANLVKCARMPIEPTQGLPTSWSLNEEDSTQYMDTEIADDAESWDDDSTSPGKMSKYVENRADLVDVVQAQEEELQEESKSLIWILAKQVRIGQDLSKVVLPTFILEPRSFLEKVSDFFTHCDFLSRAAASKGEDRLLNVVRWFLSGFYLKPRGVKKPYNPILGETFRCCWDDPVSNAKTFYVSEQVSHHPPVSAFYVQNRRAGFVISGSVNPRSKFYGNSAASILDGTGYIQFLDNGEVYEFTFPNGNVKGVLVGTLSYEYGGEVSIVCQQSDLRAEIKFEMKPMFGGKLNVISGKVKEGKDTLYTLKGFWDNAIELIPESGSKPKETLWNPAAKDRPPRCTRYVVDPEYCWETDSQVLWDKVTKAIKADDQQLATQEKNVLEQEQRDAAKRRKELKEEYVPNFFVRDMNTATSHSYRFVHAESWKDSEEYEYEWQGLLYSKRKGEQEPEPSKPEHSRPPAVHVRKKKNSKVRRSGVEGLGDDDDEMANGGQMVGIGNQGNLADRRHRQVVQELQSVRKDIKALVRIVIVLAALQTIIIAGMAMGYL
eukprot:Clim_evm37s232 gene=Clim_evmTU37s232